MENQQEQELLALDMEPAEDRVKSWLSNSDLLRTPLEHNFEFIGEMSNTNPNVHFVQQANICVYQETHSGNVPRSLGPVSCTVKRGLEKYFVSTDVQQGTPLSPGNDSATSSANRPYCNAERISMLQHIVEKELYAFVKGNFIWQQMEKEKVCARTWQSMKTQFQKYIYPHLDEFPLEESARGHITEAMERVMPTSSQRYLEPGQRGWRRNCKFYSFLEDTLILFYILERHRYQFAHGNTMWKRMQTKNIVPGRSWHSLKSRYKKFLAKYVEKFAPNNKRSMNFIGSMERAKILDKFQLDYLVHMSVFKGSTSKSRKETTKQLKILEMELSALPDQANKSESDNIKSCAYIMVQQLTEKVEQLMQAHENNIQKKETILMLPSRGLSNDVCEPKMKTLSFRDNTNNISFGNGIEDGPSARRTQVVENSDIFENVQPNDEICTSDRCERKNGQFNLKTNVNEMYVNAQRESCTSSNRTHQPECDVYDGNESSSDETQSDDETQTDESEYQSNRDVPFSDVPLNVNNNVNLFSHSTLNKSVILNCMTDVEKNIRLNKNIKENVEKRNLLENLPTNFMSDFNKHDDQHTQLTHVNESNTSTCAEDNSIPVLVSYIPENFNSEENVQLNVQMQFVEPIYQDNQEICIADDVTNTEVNMTNDSDELVEQTNKSVTTAQHCFITNVTFKGFNPDIPFDISSGICSGDILAPSDNVVEHIEDNSRNINEVNFSISQQLIQNSTVSQQSSIAGLAGCSKMHNTACASTSLAPLDVGASDSEDDIQYSLRLSTDDSDSESSS